MRKISAFALLLTLTASLGQTSLAQSRPRRVGQTQTPQQQSQSQPQPSPDDGSQAARPSRPPVLGGANRNPNEQKPTEPQKDAGPEEVSEGDIVRVNTTLVSIPVSVTDRDGKYIPDLRKENFRIWEDGIEQQVAYFASTEKPFTVALVIDTSGSVRERLQEIQDAAMAFVNNLRADDRVMVVSFDDKIRFITSEPTSDRYAIRSAIQQVRAGSGTRLYDAVDQVMKKLNGIQGRKAIVLFTDGVDTTSKHKTYEDTVSEAEELDALIYPIEFDTYQDMAGGWPGSRRGGRGGGGGGGGGGNYPSGGNNPGGGGNPNGRSSGSVIGDILGGIFGGGGNYPNGGGSGRGGRGGGGGWPGGGSGNSREEYERGDRYLNDLARVTGARLYKGDNDNLSVAFRQVAEELRRQYSLGYYPKRAPQPGERRTIKVRVDRPDVVARTRDSYVFGQSNGATTAQSQPTQQQKPPVLKKELIGGRF